MKNNAVLIDLHYLPCLEYFVCLSNYTRLIVDINEPYQKQTFRNRCHILTSQKVETLSIPVLNGNSKPNIKTLKIDYKQKWVNNHWRAIQSAYGKAPFFEFYADFFHTVFYKRKEYLIELNLEFLKLCLNFLNLEIDLEVSDRFLLEVPPGVDDLRSVIYPKEPFTKRHFYNPFPYPQIFGENFYGNLSIIDLLFCEGPNARQILKNSVPVKE
ncbi:hypothetical protein E1171_12745 [Cytophagales bacterium RKSG123]|nr:WbqC family protein [Xanthovirga aplysinae]MTI31679.1 hypothetical protein [Xanthovirga aplysinae]